MAERVPGRTYAELGLSVARDGGMVQRGQGVPAFWFARAIETGSQEVLSEPYRNSPWVSAAINIISQPIASVGVDFFSADSAEERSRTSQTHRTSQTGRTAGHRAYRTARGIVRRENESRIELPEMDDFLREPMAGMTWVDFVEATVGWWKMAGESFWLMDDRVLVPFPDVRPAREVQVVVARPDKMRHVVQDGRLMGWEYTDGDGKRWTLLPEQVIQIKRWNPYNKWRGLSEYESAQVAAEADWLAGKFSRNLMANNGDTGPYIVAKNGIPSDPQREQILADLRAKRQAQQRGDFRPIFLTGDIEVQDPQVRSVDTSYIASRLENRHEIFIAMRVPPSMADVKAAYSIGSASDFYQLITNTCIPTGCKLAGGLVKLTKIFCGRDVECYLDWDEHPVMQEVRKERLASIDGLWSKGMPMEAINDYLGLELPEYEGWDIGYLPMGVSPAMAPENEEPAAEPSQAPEFGEEPESSTGGTGVQPSEGNGEEAETPGPVAEMVGALRGRAEERKGKNARLWELHMRRRAVVMKQYRSKVNRVLAQFRGIALRRLAEYGAAAGRGQRTEDGGQIVQRGVIDFIFDPTHFGKELVAAINPVAHGALQTAADQLLKGELGITDPWKYPPAKALDFVISRTQSIAGAGQTVRNQINTTLEEGIVNGESIDELSDRVRGAFNSLSNYESKRIAMTETACAFNTARDEAMRASGVQYERWVSSHGPTVRPAHAEAEKEYESEPIPIDEPFVVGGEELMYPGDPSGSPENIINCQCISVAVEKEEG